MVGSEHGPRSRAVEAVGVAEVAVGEGAAAVEDAALPAAGAASPLPQGDFPTEPVLADPALASLAAEPAPAPVLAPDAAALISSSVASSKRRF